MKGEKVELYYIINPCLATCKLPLCFQFLVLDVGQEILPERCNAVCLPNSIHVSILGRFLCGGEHVVTLEDSESLITWKKFMKNSGSERKTLTK
jgi:hypothetical protein